jgi:glycolate oxidase FAD binding subunit
MVSLFDNLVGLLGSDAVEHGAGLHRYSVDGVCPTVAAFPARVEAVSQVMRLASGEGRAVVPWGGGTQMALGNTPRRLDLVLGLGRLDRLVFHEPADLVASVEAGMTIDALQRHLGRQGQFLPLEAPLPSRATVGGVLASNASGPSRLAYGTARDWLIGITVVQASGDVTRSGGRVVKNVTGYDLNKLYTGSLGTLGVIVAATFKVAPLPRERRTLVVGCASLDAALEACRRLLGQAGPPQALVAVDRGLLERQPMLRRLCRGEAMVAALFAGRTSPVARKLADAATALGGGGATEVTDLPSQEGEGLWRALTDFGWAEEARPQLMARISLLPSQVEPLLREVRDHGGRAPCRGVVADPGTGLVRVLVWVDPREPEALDHLETALSALQRAAESRSGHLVVERCPLELKRRVDVWGGKVEGVDIMRRVKHELDPGGILSPGRFVARI